MRFVPRALASVMFLALGACTTIEDLMPMGPKSGATPLAATSTTPGLAVDRKPGYPPYAMMKGTVLIAPHGAKRTDYYFWMNEKNTEKVIRYLEEENKYAGEAMARTGQLQSTLRSEIRARAAAAQGTPPFREGDWWYYERFAPGADYPVIARRRGSPTGSEEILLDGQSEGVQHDQFIVNNYTATPDGSVFAYAADYSGDRWHTIVMRDMKTGRVLDERIKYTAPDLAFADDNRTLFYISLQPGTARPYRLMRHTIGTDPKVDRIVFEEKDQQFELSVHRSKGGRALFLSSRQTNASEVYLIDPARPDSKWSSIRPRSRGLIYDAEELGGQLFIRTNLEAPDYRIMTAAISQPGKWVEIVPARIGVYIAGLEVVKGALALDEWTGGASRIRIHDLSTGAEKLIPADGPAGHMTCTDTWAYPVIRNTDPDTSVLRYLVSSPVVPDTVYDYDTASGKRHEVRRMSVPGFAPAAYATERTFAIAPDGRQVPVTLAWRRDKAADGNVPLLLYGYGAYGASNDPVFSSLWPSLLDRGFMIGFAHVRGGREMGEAWYQDGKLRNKRNSFTDFIAIAEHMSRSGRVDPKRIFAMGGSAGGLLVGAVANMRPDLFRGIVANVPFVDVMTTMLDDSLPLTTVEYEEWGNPADPGDYEYMLGYSPYDQVDRRAYPAMLVTAGYNDSQVSYFEPAKWVAKLRRLKSDTNPLIFRINMTAGHAGESGRFGGVDEAALTTAFLLDQAGLNPSAPPSSR